MNIKCLFVRLTRSKIAEEYVKERLERHLERFHHLRTLRSVVKFEMVNSGKANDETYSCTVRITSPFFKNIIVRKTGKTLTGAISEVLNKVTLVLSKIHSARTKQRKTGLSSQLLNIDAITT